MKCEKCGYEPSNAEYLAVTDTSWSCPRCAWKNSRSVSTNYSPAGTGKIPNMNATMRIFDTGATRSNDAGKIDPEGFLSPLVIERYCQYLNKHRVQADGKLRDSDNWQKGMPTTDYIKSAWRHFLDLWKIHRGFIARDVKTGEIINKENAICAVLFNCMGYLHETLKEKTNAK